jgi:hypothetical protein
MVKVFLSLSIAGTVSIKSNLELLRNEGCSVEWSTCRSEGPKKREAKEYALAWITTLFITLMPQP